VLERIVWAWVLTLPVTGVTSYILARAAAAF
jgi:phosphate/sulfate permease